MKVCARPGCGREVYKWRAAHSIYCGRDCCQTVRNSSRTVDPKIGLEARRRADIRARLRARGFTLTR